jgi:predicted transposase YbfD/YdcC
MLIASRKAIPLKERAMAISVPHRAAVPTPESLVVSPQSLAAAFARVPDPRRAASVQYPLAAILNLVVVALLTQQTSVLAIAEWAGRQSAASLRALGFPTGRTPCQSTLHRLLCKLDGHALADALRTHFAGAAVGLPAPGTVQGVALDGKAQRGRLAYQTGGCPVHALSAFCHEHGVVLAQAPIVQGTEKAEAELSVAPAVIAQVAWPGRVLTGDALYCQRALCTQVLAAGGDYLLLVKENQPSLLEALATHFDPPATLAALPPLDTRIATTRARGHGRQGEVRTVTASTDLTAYLDWPGLAQVVRLERTWLAKGTRKREVHYLITSLDPQVGTPERLLALRRGHWAIENRLHRTKDLIFGEDASTVHRGQGPTVLAFLRDSAVSLLHRAGIRTIAAQVRAFAHDPSGALALVLADPPIPTHA